MLHILQEGDPYNRIEELTNNSAQLKRIVFHGELVWTL